LFLTVAAICGLITWDHTQRRKPFVRRWGYLTIIFLLMSIDEIALLHDRLFGKLGDLMGGGGGVFFYAWVIPALIFIAGFALFYLSFFLSLPGETRRTLVAGLALFGFGAVGMEMISGWVISNYEVRTIVVLLLTNVEELAEMLSMCVAIYALLNYLNNYCRFEIRIGYAESYGALEPYRARETINGDGVHAEMEATPMS
jgi:hypothetical protein